MINILFFPKILKSKKYKKNQNLLVSNNFWTKNETIILDNLYLLENYSQLFYVPYEYKYISYAEYIDDIQTINDTHIFGKSETNILFKLKTEELIYFETYLKTTPNKFVYRFITGFETILSSILELDKIHIIHGYINFDNIIYNENKNLVLLTNFKKSFILPNLDNKEQLLKLFQDINYENQLWPIEMHLLNFISINNFKCLSSYNIEFIIQEYSKHSILQKFNKHILDDFVSSALQYFQKYINKPIDQVLLDIYKYSYTWNNYGLSFTFLNMLVNIYHNITNKHNKFIILFMKLLVNNLNFNPTKRFSSKIYLQLFYNFLDNISQKDYFELFNDLKI